jgi:hypothetical protein
MNSETILKSEFSEKFVKGMKKRMEMSYFKYGPVETNYKNKLINGIESLKIILQKYEDTGNIEFLMDVANFAMIEWMFPQHEKAYFKATDSNESPGVHGMGINEVKNFEQQ